MEFDKDCINDIKHKIIDKNIGIGKDGYWKITFMPSVDEETIDRLLTSARVAGVQIIKLDNTLKSNAFMALPCNGELKIICDRQITLPRNCSSLWMDLEYCDVDFTGVEADDTFDVAEMFTWTKVRSVNMATLKIKKMTTMYEMFADCDQLVNLNISSLDTSNVVEMTRLFMGCTKLKAVDISNFAIRQDCECREMLIDSGLQKIIVKDIATKLLLEKLVALPYYGEQDTKKYNIIAKEEGRCPSCFGQLKDLKCTCCGRTIDLDL